MERYRLNQWCVTVGSQQMAMFTTLNCDEETAMAIAVATFGSEVTKLVDEGRIHQNLTSSQLHVANSKNCEECGMSDFSYSFNIFRNHDENCSKLVSEKCGDLE